MSAPISPALVRAAMEFPETDGVTLRDHIRTTAAEAREAAKEVRAEGFESIGAYRLEELANKLEGIE